MIERRNDNGIDVYPSLPLSLPIDVHSNMNDEVAWRISSQRLETVRAVAVMYQFLDATRPIVKSHSQRRHALDVISNHPRKIISHLENHPSRLSDRETKMSRPRSKRSSPPSHRRCRKTQSYPRHVQESRRLFVPRCACV